MMCGVLLSASTLYGKLYETEEDVWHFLIKRVKVTLETWKTARKEIKKCYEKTILHACVMSIIGKKKCI